MSAVDPVFAAECAAIDAAREQMFADLKAARLRGLMGRDLDASLKASATLDARMATLKSKFYPKRAGRLSVALGSAILISPTGRTTWLWSAPPVEADEDAEGQL
jgi:hypothetical protein